MSVNVCIYGQIRYICLGMNYFLCRTTMAVRYECLLSRIVNTPWACREFGNFHACLTLIEAARFIIKVFPIKSTRNAENFPDNV